MAFEIRNIGEALDLDTGQVVALTPDYIKQLDDETLAQFIYESKRFAKLPKAGEEELKSRLESGKRFSMVDFGSSRPLLSRSGCIYVGIVGTACVRCRLSSPFIEERLYLAQ